MTLANEYAWPDDQGRFGPYGGRFVSETLMPAIQELDAAYAAARADPAFQAELDGFLEHYVGRASPLYFAERLTEHFGGARIWLKREDLNHTGAHKINNCIGQALLARRMHKGRVIAETGDDPDEIIAELVEWQEKTAGLKPAVMPKPAKPAAPGAPGAAEPDDDDAAEQETEAQDAARKAMRFRLIANRSDE